MMLNIIILIDSKYLAELTNDYKAQASKFLIFGQMLSLIENVRKLFYLDRNFGFLKYLIP